ncbi:MAG: cysteine synthase A [Syntrophomonadaceae bacterium]|nr:cysteine synthase A [Syntrophomonadaceae bacterium]
MIANNIIELIGKTPIVRLNRQISKPSVEVLAKLESFNPASSVKDRIAFSMIKSAEEKGILKPGGTIIEPTSGNTGIALAMIGAAKGYKVVLVMPETMSIERRALAKGFGAELVLTPGAEGMKGAVRVANELCANNPDWIMLQQFSNPSNPEIHRLTTGPEIYNDVEGKLDYLVAGVGTGGTITGVGGYLKEKIPNLKVIAVEPRDSAVLSGNPPGSHKIQGIGAGFIPDVLDLGVIDEIIPVSNEDAFATSKKLMREEGIMVGISAGAIIGAALELAKREGVSGRILAIAPDTAERYISTPLFTNE